MLRHSLALFGSLLFVFAASGVAGERSVSATEVNGTYRCDKSEIKVLALGRGKLKVQLNLIFEYGSPKAPMANMGDALGEATIANDVAVFVPEEAYGTGKCKITMTFLPNGTLRVEQEGSDADCGFGHNVRADGTYRKVSKKKPVFDET